MSMALMHAYGQGYVLDAIRAWVGFSGLGLRGLGFKGSVMGAAVPLEHCHA